MEAYQVGGAAVKAADEGDSGKMVVLERRSDDPYQCGTEVKDVHKIANDEKVVPREWVNKEGTYVTDEFVTYVRPLIQGDVSPVMVDGIPTLKQTKIKESREAHFDCVSLCIPYFCAKVILFLR